MDKTDVSPGDTFMPARRFLGDNPEFVENSINREGFHAIRYIHGTIHYIILKHTKAAPFT